MFRRAPLVLATALIGALLTGCTPASTQTGLDNPASAPENLSGAASATSSAESPSSSLADAPAPEDASDEAPCAPEPVPTTAILTVYAPDGAAEGFVATDVEVASIDKDTVVQHLADAGVLADGVAINSLTVGDGRVNVDFNAAFATHLQSMGTTGEYLTLGSVVNTLLAAFDAQSAVVTVDGQPLETGHNVYDQPLSLYA